MECIMEKSAVEVVFQVGFVVDDLDKYINNLKKYFDLNEESINFKTMGVNDGSEFFYNGEKINTIYRRARLDFGGIDFEYIEPLNKDGGDPYSDWLKEHGPGINHINMKLGNRSIMDKNMESEGRKPLFVVKNGDMALESYDFRDLFGFIGELGDMVVGPMSANYYENK